MSRKRRRGIPLGALLGFGIVALLLLPFGTPEEDPIAPQKFASTAAKVAKRPVVGKPAPKPESSPPPPVSLCPEDMVYVSGSYCPNLAHVCVDYLSEKRDRCAEYRPTSRCFGTPVAKRVCIDRYEFPNQPGIKPEVAVSWDQARALCSKQGKRLCTESEWTLACEGPGRVPYPYGYVRDAAACNIDKPYIVPNDAAFQNPTTRERELARLDQREPSGERQACVSPYGVFDMTGNVDEWVYNEKGHTQKTPYISGLKGGYWGPVRNRCRPMTTDHNTWHFGYQIGFRCCADAADNAAEATGTSTPQEVAASNDTTPSPPPQ